MALTVLQAHVLGNIDRVAPISNGIRARSARRQFELDGRDCTPQVTSLCIKGLIRLAADGRYARRPGIVATSKLAGMPGF